MKFWRLILLAALVLVPAIITIGLATWALWHTNWLGWIWWLMPVFWGAAWLLARRWRNELLAAAKAEAAPIHWTPRDEQAFEIVRARQAAVSEIPPAKLVDARHYVDDALDLSLAIAKHYHPKASDPVSSLTVPEILAAGHLAFEDLEGWVQQYVPGSHLVTVRHLRMLSQAPQWYDAFSNLAWIVSIVANPVANIPRLIASKTILASATNDLQANLLAAFYAAFLARVGRYCIEMNSGRLRGGAAPYRAAMAKLQADGKSQPAPAGSPVPTPSEAPPETTATPEPAGETQLVTLAIVGQVKAGKSSLINALRGDRAAKVDVLPETRSVQRHRLDMPDAGSNELILLDTPGYNESGANASRDREVRVAVRQADLVLLVLDAKSPSRQTDVEFIRNLADWMVTQPKFKPPPILLVLSHIDLLSPALEWSPPYDWQTPQQPKETSMHEAVAYNAELFGERVAGVIPVCTDVERNRVYGVREWLIPAIAAALDEARAVSVIRALHAEIDSGKVRTVFRQLANAGRGLVRRLLTPAGP